MNKPGILIDANQAKQKVKTLNIDSETLEKTEDAPRFRHRSLLRRMPIRSQVAGIIILAVVVVAFAAPLLPLHDPYVGSLSNRFLDIGSPGHLLGTDDQGRDLLSRLIYATRTSLITGVVPIVFASVIGILWGVSAGYSPRWLNGLLMRTLDIFFAFPAVLLALLISITMGIGIATLILALTVVWIAPIARIVETEVVRIRELDYVVTATASGATTFRIVIFQIVPVAIPAALAYATSLVGANVAISGGLGFIGLGIPSPTAEIGAMIQEMQSVIFSNPSLALLPVLLSIGLSVVFPILGDGLQLAVAGQKED